MIDFKDYKDLLKSDRSIRRFDESKRIGENTLVTLVELTRYCASGRNLQPIRYRLVHTPEECAKVFPALKWAGYLPEWDGPEEGERPAAYLIQCLDTDLTNNLLCDDGLQLQAITLGANVLGIGGCIIKSFNMAIIKDELHIPENMKPIYVLALGCPVEEVVIDDISNDGDIKYWRDSENVHHVPKRVVSELLID